MTEGQIRFLRRRRRLLRRAPEILGIVALAFVWVAAWMWWRVPLMVNPWMVIEGVQQGKIAVDTLALMAMMLPVFGLTLLVLSAMLLGAMGLWVRQERRYHLLLDDSGIEAGDLLEETGES